MTRDLAIRCPHCWDRWDPDGLTMPHRFGCRKSSGKRRPEPSPARALIVDLVARTSERWWLGGRP